jgi:hypothetical protein
MAGKVTLRLSTEPDGFGFYYGWAEKSGDQVRVDVMPPEHLWRGDIRMTDHRPDPKAWTVYADGEELARIGTLEELGNVLGYNAPLRLADLGRGAVADAPSRPDGGQRPGLMGRLAGLWR